MAIIRDQIEFLHVLEDVCGITSDSFGEDFHHELSLKMVWKKNKSDEKKNKFLLFVFIEL